MGRLAIYLFAFSLSQTSSSSCFLRYLFLGMRYRNVYFVWVQHCKQYFNLGNIYRTQSVTIFHYTVVLCGFKMKAPVRARGGWSTQMQNRAGIHAGSDPPHWKRARRYVIFERRFSLAFPSGSRRLVISSRAKVCRCGTVYKRCRWNAKSKQMTVYRSTRHLL